MVTHDCSCTEARSELVRLFSEYHVKFISNNSAEKLHLLEIKKLIAGSDHLVICSGWMKLGGLKLLKSAIRNAVRRGCNVAIYTNPAHTEPACIKELAAWGGVFHAMPTEKYFHSKLYYGRRGNEYTAIVGSANVTAAALGGGVNDELSVRVTGSVLDQAHDELAMYLQNLPKQLSDEDSPQPVSDALDLHADAHEAE
nr:phospholipase D-like domain-containing protein [Pseudomonas psychrotolerans]